MAARPPRLTYGFLFRTALWNKQPATNTTITLQNSLRATGDFLTHYSGEDPFRTQRNDSLTFKK